MPDQFKYIIQAGFKVDPSGLNELVTEIKEKERQIQEAFNGIAKKIDTINNKRLSISVNITNIQSFKRELIAIENLIDRINTKRLIIGGQVVTPFHGGIGGATPTSMPSVAQMQRAAEQVARIQSEALTRSLERMRPRIRQVFEMAQQGRSVDQIARQLQISQASAERYLREARRIMNQEGIARPMQRFDQISSSGSGRTTLRDYRRQLRESELAMQHFYNVQMLHEQAVERARLENLKLEIEKLRLQRQTAQEHERLKRLEEEKIERARKLEEQTERNRLVQEKARREFEASMKAYEARIQRAITMDEYWANQRQINRFKQPLALAISEAQLRAFEAAGGKEVFQQAKEEGYETYISKYQQRRLMRQIMRESILAGGSWEDAVASQYAYIEKEKERLAKLSGATGVRISRSFDIIDPKTGETLKTVTYLFDEYGKAIDRTDNSLKRLGATMLRNMMFYHIAVMGLYDMVFAFQSAIRVMTEFELQWIRLSNLIQSREGLSVELLEQDVYDIGKKLGVDIEDTAQVMQQVIKQRRFSSSEQDVSIITESALMAANISAMDYTESVNKLISALRQFDLEAEKSTEIVDYWVYLFNQGSADIEDIADGVAKAGAIAKEAGVDFRFLSAMVATLVSQTGESGDMAGNAIKVFLRKMRMPPGGEVLKREAGIDIYAGPGQLKSSMQVLQELAAVWPQLTPTNRNLLAQSLAERRTSEFMALMEGLDDVLELYGNSIEAVNMAQIKNAEIMESTIKQWERLKTSAQEFAVQLGEAGVLSTLQLLINAFRLTFEFGSTLLDAFNELPGPIKETALQVMFLTGAITALNIAIEKLVGIRRVGRGKDGISGTAGGIAEGLATGVGIGVGAKGVGGLIRRVPGESQVGRLITNLSTIFGGLSGNLGKFGGSLLKTAGIIGLVIGAFQGLIFVTDKLIGTYDKQVLERQKEIEDLARRRPDLVDKDLERYNELRDKYLRKGKVGLSEEELRTYNILKERYGFADSKYGRTQYFDYIDPTGKRQRILYDPNNPSSLESIKKALGVGFTQPTIPQDESFPTLTSPDYDKAIKSVNDAFKEFNTLIKNQRNDLEQLKLSYDMLTGSIEYAYQAIDRLNEMQDIYSMQIDFIQQRLPIYTGQLQKQSEIINSLRQKVGDKEFESWVMYWEGASDEEKESFGAGEGTRAKLQTLFKQVYPEYQKNRELVEGMVEEYSKAVLEVQKLNKEKLDLILNTDRYIVYWNSIQNRIKNVKQLMIDLRNIHTDIATIGAMSNLRSSVLGREFNPAEFEFSQYQGIRDKFINNIETLVKTMSTYGEDLQKLQQAINEAQADMVDKTESRIVDPINKLIKEDLTNIINVFDNAVKDFDESAEKIKQTIDETNYVTDSSLGYFRMLDQEGRVVKGDSAKGGIKSSNYIDLINKYAEQFGINPALAIAVARQESGIRQYDESGKILKSSAGAMGIMQLMPGTARELGVDPTDPSQNIYGGIKYLRQQIDRWAGNVALGLASYNAGPGNVQKWVKRAGTTDWGTVRNFAFNETRNYVDSILSSLGSGVNNEQAVYEAVKQGTSDGFNQYITSNENAYKSASQLFGEQYSGLLTTEVSATIKEASNILSKIDKSLNEAQIGYMVSGSRSDLLNNIFQIQQSGLKDLLVTYENIRDLLFNLEHGYDIARSDYEKATTEEERLEAQRRMEYFKENTNEVKELANQLKQHGEIIQKEIDILTKQLQLDPRYNSAEANKQIVSLLIDIKNQSILGQQGSPQFFRVVEDLSNAFNNFMTPQRQQQIYGNLFEQFGIFYESFAGARVENRQFELAILGLKLNQIESYLKSATGENRLMALGDRADLVNQQYSRRGQIVSSLKEYWMNTGKGFDDFLETSAEQFAHSLWKMENAIRQLSRALNRTSNEGIVSLLALAEVENERISILDQQRSALRTAYITGHIGLQEFIQGMEQLRDTSQEFAEQALGLYEGTRGAIKGSFVDSLLSAMTGGEADLGSSLKQGLASLVAEQVGSALMNSAFLQPLFSKISTIFSGLAGQSLTGIADLLSSDDFRETINETISTLLPIIEAIADSTKGIFETLENNIFNAPSGFRIEPYLYEFARGRLPSEITGETDSSDNPLVDAGDQLRNKPHIGIPEQQEIETDTKIPDSLKEIIGLLQSINDTLNKQSTDPFAGISIPNLMLAIAKYNYGIAQTGEERQNAHYWGQLARALGATFDPRNDGSQQNLEEWLESEGLTIEEFENIMNQISADDDMRNIRLKEGLDRVGGNIKGLGSDLTKYLQHLTGINGIIEAINNIKIEVGSGGSGGSSGGGSSGGGNTNPIPDTGSGGTTNPPSGNTGGGSGGTTPIQKQNVKITFDSANRFYVRDLENYGYTVNYKGNVIDVVSDRGTLVIDHFAIINNRAAAWLGGYIENWLNQDPRYYFYHTGGYVSPAGPVPLRSDETPIIAKNGELLVNTDNLTRVNGLGGLNLTVYIDARGSNMTEDRIRTIAEDSILKTMAQLQKSQRMNSLRTTGVSYTRWKVD